LAEARAPSIVSLTKASSAQVGNSPKLDIAAYANFRPEGTPAFVEYRVALVPNVTKAKHGNVVAKF
jgi:hypothetical protein